MANTLRPAMVMGLCRFSAARALKKGWMSIEGIGAGMGMGMSSGWSLGGCGCCALSGQGLGFQRAAMSLMAVREWVTAEG